MKSRYNCLEVCTSANLCTDTSSPNTCVRVSGAAICAKLPTNANQTTSTAKIFSSSTSDGCTNLNSYNRLVLGHHPQEGLAPRRINLKTSIWHPLRRDATSRRVLFLKKADVTFASSASKADTHGRTGWSTWAHIWRRGRGRRASLLILQPGRKTRLCTSTSNARESWRERARSGCWLDLEQQQNSGLHVMVVVMSWHGGRKFSLRPGKRHTGVVGQDGFPRSH